MICLDIDRILMSSKIIQHLFLTQYFYIIIYLSGRTVDCDPKQPKGSLNETAKEIEDAGGICYPVKCDHSQDDDVKRLFERITLEQNGRLDVVVNNAFSGIRVSKL